MFDIKIQDGSLRLRSARTASCYVGRDAPPLLDPDGFVDTGDMVELAGERYSFVGRKGGIINVGGQKVHPEEVEAAINRHPAVWASLVRSRKSPITGAVVVADVVLKPSSGDGTAAQTEREIIAICRQPSRRPQGAGGAALRPQPRRVGDRQTASPKWRWCIKWPRCVT